MSDGHPDPADLERFVRGELGETERRAVVRHLLTGCPKCVAVTRRSWVRGDLPYALRVLVEEGLASQAEESRMVPFRLSWGRREEP